MSEIDLRSSKFYNDLQSEDKRKRKKTLDDIKRLVESSSDKSLINKQLECEYKLVLRCFRDKVEACREAAVNTAQLFLEVLPKDDDRYVAFLLPVIVQRIGEQNVNEQSEEVRLQLVMLLKYTISKFKTKINIHIEDIVQILSKTLLDSYPEVKKESCAIAIETAQLRIPEFYHHSEKLIKPLLLNFGHQHYKVRVAAIKAVAEVIRFGNNKSADDTIGSLAERLFDQSHIVRLASTEVVGYWLLHLPDRYSYFHRLVPLILTSLNDELVEIREKSWEMWTKIGLQYMEENEADLKDKMDYLSVELSHYPAGLTRPNLGCRTLVQRNMMKIVDMLVRELDDWKVDVRIRSSQLLCVLVLHAEENVTQHIEKLLIAMYKASLDEELSVIENIERSAEFLGYFVPVDVYCKLVLPTMESNIHSGHLRVFANILKGTDCNFLDTKLVEIADFLSRKEVYLVRDPAHQVQLLKCCLSLMTVCKNECKLISKQLFTIIVGILGLSITEDITEKAHELMNLLQLIEEVKSREDVFKLHSLSLLQELKKSSNLWTLYSPEKCVFEAILINSGVAVGLYMDAVIDILRDIAQPETDAEVKLKVFTIFSVILTNKEETLKLADDVGSHLVNFMRDIIYPCLQWRAGISYEAVRTAAASCLVAVLKDPPHPHISPFCNPYVLKATVELLAPVLMQLVDDQSHRTRLYVLHIISQLVGLLRKILLLTSEHIHMIYPAVMKRLDDVNDKVRQEAVNVLVNLFNDLPSDYDIKTSKAHIEALYNCMLIHLDDPNPEFQILMTGAIKEVAKANPEILWEKLNSSKDNFRNLQDCNEILSHLLLLNPLLGTSA